MNIFCYIAMYMSYKCYKYYKVIALNNDSITLYTL